MDFQAIGDFISIYGFPIMAYFLLYNQSNTTLKEMRDITQQNTNALNNLSNLITQVLGHSVGDVGDTK